MTHARLLLRALHIGEATVAVVAFTCVAIALVADIVMRELFGNGIFGAQRFAIFCTAISGLLGFCIVVGTGGHIRPKAVDHLIPRRLRGLADRLTNITSAAIAITLGTAAIVFVHGNFAMDLRDMVFGIPFWPVQVILPYIFFSAALRYLLYAAFPDLQPEEEDEAKAAVSASQEGGRT